MLDFTGKTVLITGAAAGIGGAASELFAKQGAAVVIVDINGNMAEEKAAAICAAGGKAEALVCDVCDPDAVEAVVKHVVDQYGRIDVFVNNAGGTHGSLTRGTIGDYSLEEFDRVVKLNLYGLFYFCRQVVPVMQKQGGGNIVVVSSGAGRMTSRSEVGRIPYAPSKAAQLGLMRQLALEHADDNIRVNAIAPGLIKSTDYIENNWLSCTEEQKNATLTKIPLHRRGTSEEIANGIVFLASDEASYITGHCLDINGGIFML
ncbi:MAG: SDR family oxidoreductase [Firmicutes bacterium]|nr:SDR family oxidoreductase [Bacillota bacterium]